MKNSNHFEKEIEICARKLEHMTSGPSIVFTRKALSGIHLVSANQSLELMRASSIPMCQDMPTGLYTRCEFDSHKQKIKARHN